MLDMDTLARRSRLWLCEGEKRAMERALAEDLAGLSILGECEESERSPYESAHLSELRFDKPMPSQSAGDALSNSAMSKNDLFCAAKE